MLNIYGDSGDQNKQNQARFASAQTQAQGQGQEQGEGKNKKKKVIKVAGSRQIDESLFKPSYSLASTLSGSEQIPNVNAGVVVKSASSFKEGPAIVEDGRKISRKSYLSKSMATSIFGQSKQNSPTGFGKTDSLDSYGAEDLDQSLAIGFAEDDNTILPTSMMSNTQFPDMNMFEGSRRVKPASRSNYETNDTSDDIGGMTPTVTSQQNGLQAAAGGIRPIKPSIQQVNNIEKLTGGAGLIRDRDLPLNMKTTADRKKLPAPPLGQVSGHGLSPEKSTVTASNVSVGSSKNDSQSQSQSQYTDKNGLIKREKNGLYRRLL